MAKKYWIIGVVIALTANFTYAAEREAKVTVATPAPYFKDPTAGVEMVYIKGGCYQMGANEDDNDAYPEESPAHEVCLAGFYMGKYEVTQGQWQLIMGSNSSTPSTCNGNNCPVDNVSWSGARDFIITLNSKSGGGTFRLPTEAEWEYAARSGGRREKYSGGNTLDSVAWYAENSGRKNHPVGTKAPNGLGIYDMSGNVWEWTNDWYGSDYYKNSTRNHPSGPDSGADRVVRGGCVTGEAANLRVSRRTGYPPDFRKPALGFRILRTP